MQEQLPLHIPHFTTSFQYDPDLEVTLRGRVGMEAAVSRCCPCCRSSPSSRHGDFTLVKWHVLLTPSTSLVVYIA